MCDSSNDSDTEEKFTPPDIIDNDITTEITSNILPEKSKKKYEKCYQDFIDWKEAKKSTSFSETVLIAYFQELSNFKSSTLWTYYSMLKSTLSIHHQTDISKYSKLLSLLKSKSEGFKGKKSKTFSSEEINKFLKEAPDQQYLSVKVAFIFGIIGACRRQELHNLQFKDVQVCESSIFIKIFNTKTKTDRIFTITGKYYDYCKQYINLRPNPCNNTAFFLNYKNGKCTAQNVGINKFGTLGKTIAKYLNLRNPELYTGHCFRRTSATVLVDAGGDITTLKKRDGCKSTAVAEGYVVDSMESKIHVSNQILNTIENNNTNEVNINIPSTSTNMPEGSVPVINFNNCTIQNVNYYIINNDDK